MYKSSHQPAGRGALSNVNHVIVDSGSVVTPPLKIAECSQLDRHLKK